MSEFKDVYNRCENGTLGSFENDFETIRRALLIADKVMGEPSDNMVEAGWESEGLDYRRGIYILEQLTPVYKAMRDQMIKEIE